MSVGGFIVNAEMNQGAVFDKINAVTHNVGTMIDISRKVVEVIDPYVPYDTGNLSNSATFVHTLEGTSIVYEAPYASKVYHGVDIAFHKDKHPLATAYWDKVAMQNERTRLAREAEAILKEKARQVKSNG